MMRLLATGAVLFSVASATAADAPGAMHLPQPPPDASHARRACWPCCGRWPCRSPQTACLRCLVSLPRR